MAETVKMAAEETAATLPEKKKKKRGKKKIVKRVIIAVVVAGVIAGGVVGVRHLIPKDDGGEILTDFVQYGSITETVQGSGITRAKDSASITVTTAGMVTDVYVQEGQFVDAGTPLYSITSDAADTALKEAQKNVKGYQDQLTALYEDAANLNVTAGYKGKLVDVQDIKVGDDITKGTKIATLIDDTRMHLTQYYSYAYQNEVKVGQTAVVSIPGQMAQVNGKVETIHMVSRISAEGSKLFEVVVVMDNPGTLTADVAASAVLTSSGGETIYPYESGKLEYYRTNDVTARVNGRVEQVNLLNYMDVSAGQLLVQIGGDDTSNEIFTAENNLKSAQEKLDEAQKNVDNLNAVAPISGTVLSLGVSAGEEIAANTTTINIADTSVMIIDANVDERYISHMQAGTYVDIDQWGDPYTGYVESVSLTGKYENGVSTFPAVISVENPDGTMMSGSSANYTLVVGQADDCLMVPIICVHKVQLDDAGTVGSVVYVKSDVQPDNALELPYGGEDVPEGFWPVQVETGVFDTSNVEIISGLEEGMEVYTQTLKQNSWG